ncbi:MAG: glycosyltransferase, partial [Rikenellaceae bacterium]|nr:glycosyltransferase [Rikenellaceae bacterium]
MTTTRKRKIIVSGGGTGGHIYPAVAVVEALTKRPEYHDCQVIFVGALGKMEMTKIPALGYRIVGLPISGLKRKLSLDNLLLPFKVCKSLAMASGLLRKERPDVVVGFGGYASLPLLWMAQRRGVPTVLWEGNSFAGLANKMLGRRASKVCVSYDGMERFFDAGKIVFTGNPVR